jgi:hypothetical protein
LSNPPFTTAELDVMDPSTINVPALTVVAPL